MQPYETQCRSIKGGTFRFEFEEDGIHVSAKGDWLHHWTRITATARFCTEVDLAIADGARSKEDSLTPSELLTNLGDLRVTRDPYRLAGIWLDRSSCEAMQAVDDYARYEFKLDGGRVSVNRYELECDGERLKRAIAVAISLARRGQQLREDWIRLSDQLHGQQQRHDDDEWSLTAATPIALYRYNTYLTIDTEVTHAGVCQSHFLHTTVHFAGSLRNPYGEIAGRDFCAVVPNESGVVFYLPGFLTDVAQMDKAMSTMEALCQAQENRRLGPYR
jgi:hypothetical protein